MQPMGVIVPGCAHAPTGLAETLPSGRGHVGGCAGGRGMCGGMLGNAGGCPRGCVGGCEGGKGDVLRDAGNLRETCQGMYWRM